MVPSRSRSRSLRSEEVVSEAGSNGWSNVSALQRSPYLTPWLISVPEEPRCLEVYPKRQSTGLKQGPLGSIKDLRHKNQRLLLVVPRHGLGNSLRGYVSSFVYASLSARRLVRFHGSAHAKVFDMLCLAFHCGFEGIGTKDGREYEMNKEENVDEEKTAEAGSYSKSAKDGDVFGEDTAASLAKQLEVLKPVNLHSKWKSSKEVRLSIRSSIGLLVAQAPHFFDGFWQNYPSVRGCVLRAFGCGSTWCVHSRAMQALVGAPTPLLDDVISRVLMRHGRSPDLQDELAGADSSDFFDIAVHFRTRTNTLEGGKSDSAGMSTSPAEMKVGCGAVEAGEVSQYLRNCLWNCLGGLIQQLKSEVLRRQQPLKILLATDNQLLRPVFVDKLAEYGTVFYSSGAITHSSKHSGEQADLLPTMAEFYLMSRSHVILEAGSYISTFAHFAGLLGNGTLAGLSWSKDGTCGLNVVHQGELTHQR